MPAPRKYDQETRDRAVRMYQDRRQAHPGEAAIESRRQIAALLDVHSETLRGWVERAEIDACARQSMTTDEHAELIRLPSEVGELLRANEILKKASAYVRCRCHRAVRGHRRDFLAAGLALLAASFVGP